MLDPGPHLQSQIAFRTGTLRHWLPCVQERDIMQSITYTHQSHMHMTQRPHDGRLRKTSCHGHPSRSQICLYQSPAVHDENILTSSHHVPLSDDSQPFAIFFPARLSPCH